MASKPRWQILLLSQPDPISLERLEDHGFFFGDIESRYIRFVGDHERKLFEEMLKKLGYDFQVAEAPGRGQFSRYPRLSDELIVSNGGDETHCGLCGMTGVDCRKWIEGDDADDIRDDGARSFYMCGGCVQSKMDPHPRIYSPVDDRGG